MPITIQEYLDAEGNSPFARWFGNLDPIAAAKVATSLYRLEQGNFSRVEGAGGGIFECKINLGPVIGFTLGRTGKGS